MNVTVVYTFGPDVRAVYGRVEAGPGAGGILPTMLAVNAEHGQTDIPIDNIVRIDHFDSRARLFDETEVGAPATLHTWVPGDRCPEGLESAFDKHGTHWFRNAEELWTDHGGNFAHTWLQLLQRGPLTDRYIGLRVSR